MIRFSAWPVTGGKVGVGGAGVGRGCSVGRMPHAPSTAARTAGITSFRAKRSDPRIGGDRLVALATPVRHLLIVNVSLSQKLCGFIGLSGADGHGRSHTMLQVREDADAEQREM